MALSATRDATFTAQDIIEGAFSICFRKAENQSLSATQLERGRVKLQNMLRSWAATQIFLWLWEEQEITTVDGTNSYTLDPRTLETRFAFRRTSGNDDIPINLLERQDYLRLPSKSAEGVPHSIFIDRKRTSVDASLYPTPDGVYSIFVSSKRQILDVAAVTDETEMPPEWQECLEYQLALRMAPDLKAKIAPEDRQFAMELFHAMTGQDRGGSIYMRPSRRRRR